MLAQGLLRALLLLLVLLGLGWKHQGLQQAPVAL
jgi:hypothetical protein